MLRIFIILKAIHFLIYKGRRIVIDFTDVLDQSVFIAGRLLCLFFMDKRVFEYGIKIFKEQVSKPKTRKIWVSLVGKWLRNIFFGNFLFFLIAMLKKMIRINWRKWFISLLRLLFQLICSLVLLNFVVYFLTTDIIALWIRTLFFNFFYINPLWYKNLIFWFEFRYLIAFYILMLIDNLLISNFLV